ncbi:hypothetical protein NEHOM01_2260 [Nematocida homosporus]|uniref:uncharacterized protein n=1 Tax=Nematocida homosporus TaxID=1912981 RepID=UPI00221F4B53|nr:uncharacterized protein NEHOM01_2260 [Nematocida homosporus]KAI5187545.1 hypothetical protein NEHOM01_2260 [Nematocida homosporus]
MWCMEWMRTRLNRKIPVGVQKRMRRVKYWLLGYSKEEVMARETLSNYKSGSIKELGMLIAGAFMSRVCMDASLRVAFERLRAKERAGISKAEQYSKSLIFLQKVGMQSDIAKEEIKRNYLTILPFVFYNNKGSIAVDIRVVSIAVLKLASQDRSYYVRSATTYITCLSDPKEKVKLKTNSDLSSG